MKRTELKHLIKEIIISEIGIDNFKSIKPEAKKSVEPGAIMEYSWGFDQTNIEFFCVLDRKNDSITLIKMNQDSVDDKNAFMVSTETPTTIDWNSKPTRKQLKKYGDKEYCRFEYGSCHLWDGKPARASHYA